MKFFQRLGKSLMLPVAALPIAALLYGIGYWISSVDENVVSSFLQSAGGAIINNMGILFAIGVAVGMAKDNDGTAALAALISWLVVTTLLSPGGVAALKGIAVDAVDPAFSKIGNQFIGILSGLNGALCYNRFRSIKLPDALGFFSGKRSVAIVAATVASITSALLFFVWPLIYNGLVAFGKAILSLGGVGSAIYVFLNRLLIPFGLHHALNSVFWFDIAGINDLANFWNGSGVFGQSGVYMTGFFPIMMFGLPAGALAMYGCIPKKRRKRAGALLISAAVASFFTGVTEPLEFAFMFLAPGLYFVHALLAGISALICSYLPFRIGFNFSGGLIDYILSFKAPMAQNPLLLIPIGLGFAAIYYIVFRVVITVFDLKTPGREDVDEKTSVKTEVGADYALAAADMIDALGGRSNILSLDNCVTRLRIEIKDRGFLDENAIKSAGGIAVIYPSKKEVQVVIGPKVQFLSDAMKEKLK